MKTEQLIVYVTGDGRKFFDENEAKIHDDKLHGTKYYRVYYNLNKNEEQKIGYIICTATLKNELWVEGWLYEQFGNKVSLDGLIEPKLNWEFHEVEHYFIDESKLLTRIFKA
jgi:hypothetical protein